MTAPQRFVSSGQHPRVAKTPLLALLLFSVVATSACGRDHNHGSSPISSGSAEEEGGGGSSGGELGDTDVFDNIQSCNVPSRREEVRFEAVTRAGAFSLPVTAVRARHDPDAFYVVELMGRVKRVLPRDFQNDPTTVVDLSHRLMPPRGEMGLWGFAIHPAFPQVPHAYVFYSGYGGTTDFRSVLSRLTSYDGGRTFDASSEEVLLSIDRFIEGIHAGGHLAFGPDGYLYVSTGDGELFGDPDGNSQNPDSLLGKMLRIDVDGTSAGRAYRIPVDNPYALSGGAPEVYARGLRNPFRWSFDRETGDLWLGDVGHLRFEEINRIVLGGNYGWNLREGISCFTSPGCLATDLIDPEFVYDHSTGASVTAGYVYRGSLHPDLVGQFIYADFASGTVNALSNGKSQLLSFSGRSVTSFAEDKDGELYLVDFGTGALLEILPAEQRSSSPPPTLLSETGCFDGEGLIPYEVNTPLWSDGLSKDRALRLPKGRRIGVTDSGRLELPLGSVVLKSFRDDESGRLLETRILSRDAQGWAGFTYVWNDDQSDAVLTDEGAELLRSDGGVWTVPAKAQCSSCHTAAAGYVLGLEVAQLERGSQLDFFSSAGILATGTPKFERLRALGDGTASLRDRARSYLHANCSGCHRPGAQGDGMDFRLSASMREMRVCRTGALTQTYDLNPGYLIEPGVPRRSVLWRRMTDTGPYRMPPLGSHRVDAEAAAIVGAWIDSLSDCEG